MARIGGNLWVVVATMLLGAWAVVGSREDPPAPRSGALLAAESAIGVPKERDGRQVLREPVIPSRDFAIADLDDSDEGVEKSVPAGGPSPLISAAPSHRSLAAAPTSAAAQRPPILISHRFRC
ncbi:MAG: hypothetical protein IRY99_06970 [Isosphaeraceae bacterium]|nr:hypothetical protein [Isosphaeraceae bacterium]